MRSVPPSRTRPHSYAELSLTKLETTILPSRVVRNTRPTPYRFTSSLGSPFGASSTLFCMPAASVRDSQQHCAILIACALPMIAAPWRPRRGQAKSPKRPRWMTKVPASAAIPASSRAQRHVYCYWWPAKASLTGPDHSALVPVLIMAQMVHDDFANSHQEEKIWCHVRGCRSNFEQNLNASRHSNVCADPLVQAGRALHDLRPLRPSERQRRHGCTLSAAPPPGIRCFAMCLRRARMCGVFFGRLM